MYHALFFWALQKNLWVKFGTGQIAKSMIQSDFDTMIGSKPIGFSGSEFSFVVQTLYYPTGESFLGPEPIEQQGSMIP